MIAFIPSLQTADSVVDLVQNVHSWDPTTRTEAAIVTEVTAADRHCAVDIGTSESSVDADLLHPMTEALSQKEVITEITQSSRTPVSNTTGSCIRPRGRIG